MCKACDPDWKDKLGRTWNEAKSTDPCDTCGHLLRECTCISIRLLCCGGSLHYGGHLGDCVTLGGTFELTEHREMRLMRTTQPGTNYLQ